MTCGQNKRGSCDLWAEYERGHVTCGQNKRGSCDLWAERVM